MKVQLQKRREILNRIFYIGAIVDQILSLLLKVKLKYKTN
jgi:hypothetical protein